MKLMWQHLHHKCVRTQFVHTHFNVILGLRFHDLEYLNGVRGLRDIQRAAVAGLQLLAIPKAHDLIGPIGL